MCDMKEYPIDRIIRKFPEAFSEDGKNISSCPEGWEVIVEGFCASLATYKASYRSEETKCLGNTLINVCVPIVKKLELLFKPKIKTVVLSLSNSKTKKPIKKPFTLHGFFRGVWLKLLAKKQYQKVYPKDTRIDQVKEKFGGLRIYMTHYDKHVGGMIGLAETLCDQTCEDSGEKGVLCKKGMWYKTLSLDKAKEMGYTPVKKQDV